MGLRVRSPSWLFHRAAYYLLWLELGGGRKAGKGLEQSTEGVNFQPKKSGSGKEVMEIHQELFNKGKDMSCT